MPSNLISTNAVSALSPSSALTPSAVPDARWMRKHGKRPAAVTATAKLGASAWQALLGASRADAEALDALVQWLELPQDSWLFTHRTPAQALVLLVAGDVALGRCNDAVGANVQAMPIERLVHGPAWLDASSAWLDGPHTLDARALGAVQVAELPKAALQALLAQRPALAERFIAVQAREVQRLSVQAHELMHKDAPGRLAAWLHRRADHAQAVLQLIERKRDIAAQLGMTPETLSRQMRSLSEQGVIEVKGYRVRVLDAMALQRLAEA